MTSARRVVSLYSGTIEKRYGHKIPQDKEILDKWRTQFDTGDAGWSIG